MLRPELVVALRVLFVKSWVDDLGPALAALRDAGLDVTHERVDIAPALWAALERARWDVIVCCWKTPQLTISAVNKIISQCKHKPPVVVLDRLETLGRDVRKVFNA